MKFKVYTVTFPRELTPSEQSILIGELKCMVAYWQTVIEKELSKFDRKEIKLIGKIPNVQTAMDFAKYNINKKKINILNYVKLGIDDNEKNKYKLCVATAEVSLINSKIKLFGRNFDIQIGKLMDDEALLNHIKNIIIPLMNFKKGDVVYGVETEEMDWE